MTNVPLVEARGLKKHFSVRESPFKPYKLLKAVDGVDFAIYPQESFGLVGESGCGKSTLGRLILALEKPTEGQVFFEGRDLNKQPRKELRSLRKEIQVIFQDPFSSLNPRMTVRQILEEPFIIHDVPAGGRVKKLMDDVGLAQAHLNRFPHEFSGGQRQRIGIARALALNPKLIVADEPVSALDVSIQAQVLNLLKDLQKEYKLTYLFISHDFSVVRHICDRVAVMYLGKLVEIARGERLFEDPQHPYTEALLSAIPVPDPVLEHERKRILLTGDVPSPIEPPAGCRFHPRCGYAVDVCRSVVPPPEEVKAGHFAACHPKPFKDKPSAAALRENP